MKPVQQSPVCETPEILSAKPSVTITTDLLSWSFTCICLLQKCAFFLMILSLGKPKWCSGIINFTMCALLFATYDHLYFERHAEFFLCSK